MYVWRMSRVRPPALTSAVLLVVQASGQISVHALVRGPESAQASPFAPWRALKGNSLHCRSTVTPSALNAATELRREVWKRAQCRARRQHGGPRSRLLKGMEPCRSRRHNAGPHREVL